jgi:CheY-like chemotaxis protein
MDRRVAEAEKRRVPPSVRASFLPGTHIEDMRNRRILFIDDESLLREVMYELLTEMGYEVQVEESGQEALQVFSERPENYDLVLTDLMMLDMMGDEIAKRIRLIRPGMPVVVMTATPDNLPEDLAEAAGICKVLPKPVTKAELREGLRGLV